MPNRYLSQRSLRWAAVARCTLQNVSEGERSALTTACDDLQAQIEAGDRSMRHLDHDVSQLQGTLHTAMVHAEKIVSLQGHMRELRANMREQRQALREVRRAAHSLCDAVESARTALATLSAEERAADRNDAALLAEDERVRETRTNITGHQAPADNRLDHRDDVEHSTRASSRTTAIRGFASEVGSIVARGARARASVGVATSVRFTAGFTACRDAIAHGESAPRDASCACSASFATRTAALTNVCAGSSSRIVVASRPCSCRGAHAFGHAPPDRGLLLEGTQCRPERVLHGHRLLGRQRIARIRVTNATAESHHLPVLKLPQHPAAVGARIGRRLTGMIPLVLVHGQFLDFSLEGVHIDRGPHRGRVVRGDERLEQVADVRGLERVVHVHMRQCAFGHRRPRSLARLLDHGHTAGALDFAQAGRAVVEEATEHDADRSRPVHQRGAAKQRIDRRTHAMLAGATGHAHAAVLDRQVKAGRSHVDVAAPDCRPVLRVDDREAAGALENRRQRAAGSCRQMQDDEYRGAELGGKPLDHTLQEPDATGRGAYDDDVEFGHRKRGPQ